MRGKFREPFARFAAKLSFTWRPRRCGIMAPWTEYYAFVPAREITFEAGSAIMGVLMSFYLGRKFLFGFTQLCCQASIFFTALYHFLVHEGKLVYDKREALLKNRNILNVSKGRDEVCESGKSG